MSFRKRLQAVRAELVEIGEECATLPAVKAEQVDITPAVLEYCIVRQATIARCVARLCGLLVRVVDALP